MNTEIKFYKSQKDKVPYKTMTRREALAKVEQMMNDEPSEFAELSELYEAIFYLNEIVYPYF